ncbi:hypothetical protein [Maribacter sp. 2307ULW6-5]|uniref:hypothetical protein n=1 Tax=Maribacter sp. 2307ULW6-5 TaxID=3386275 RepID=UPI0039BD06DD
MKTITTLLFILFIGFGAQAQKQMENKVATVAMGIVTQTSHTAALSKKNDVARLYRTKNYRVKKALSFTTKRNRAKLA